jgi:lon-related putative ATP-dependent protease
MIKELGYKELRYFCNLDKYSLNLDLDADKIDVNSIIGQNEGAEALKFGLMVKSKGYNIYVSGPSGSGKTTFAERFARLQASKEATPPDMCYVYNFDEPNEPLLIKLKAGRGKLFKADMEELVAILKQELTKVFGSSEFEDEKERIVKRFQAEKDDIMETLQEAAKEKNFGVRTGNGGVYFMPIVDGKTISEEEFDTLDEDERQSITENSAEVQEAAAETMKKLKNIDKLIKQENEKTEYNVALLTVGYYLMSIQSKYADNDEVSKYLAAVKEDVLDNIGDFVSDCEQSEDDSLTAVMPWLAHASENNDLSRYKVNLIVDNSELEGAPVIVNRAPSYSALVGEVEYDSENGNFVTDFTKIKAGILHKANGGYLILQANDLLSTTYAWEAVKKALKTETITIEPIKEYQLGGITVTSIKPQPVPMNVKIILVGSNYCHEILREYDEDFHKLFRICAMFDYEMDNSVDNINGMLAFIKAFFERNNALPLTKDAVCRIIEHSSRLSESKSKLTTRFSVINDIMMEADTWARLDNAEEITDKYIKKAISKRDDRASLYSKKYNEMILSNDIMIATEGEQVGQINGLCVMETSEITFGMPTRITASTYMGKAGVVNIEKEAEMSGSIHDKGVQVIIGYLGGKYAQEFPLALSCRICFEQNYNGVDGDSASSTELYAIISSLSGLPINQQLAVTGSVNQMGEIQPIGGVTYKIEGFFNICKSRGLTGKQGVIIPVQNEKDLTLSDEVIEAVKDGKFHIYSVTSIDDGIELLMGKEAGKPTKNGHYPRGSVHHRVYTKLKSNYEKSAEE